MNKSISCGLAVLFVWIGVFASASQAQPKPAVRTALPAPAREGGMALQEALARRRSVRQFAATPLTQQELAQLLWAAQGANRPGGQRTAPSAGALYPLELYVATAIGFFHYDPREHQLERRSGSDLRPAMAKAALGQTMIAEAPAVFLFAAEFERTEKRYKAERTPRYVHIEVGHAAQNLLLQAVALGLDAVPVGAFEDAPLQQAVSLPATHRPLYLVPVGKPR